MRLQEKSEFLIAVLLGNTLQEKEEPVPLSAKLEETFLWLVELSKNAPCATKYDFLHNRKKKGVKA